MSDWAAKRFWTDVTVEREHEGFGIRLDGRPVKTPAKVALNVPTQSLAEAIAQEWRSIEGKVDPNVMPFTRSANAAIDKVAVQFGDVADMLAAYGGSDMLCYRADAPDSLVTRQSAGWDPLLNWAEDVLGARLVTTIGLMPIEQDHAALANLRTPLMDSTAFELTALHDLIALSGSLVLGLAVAHDRLTPDEAWNLSRIDEVWQAEQWGKDDDALALAEIKRMAFVHAATVYQMVRINLHG